MSHSLSEVEVAQLGETERALDSLAVQIKQEHEHCLIAATDMVDRAANVGRLLIEAKKKVPRGGWMLWVEDNCNFGIRQAQKYIRICREYDAITEGLRTARTTEIGINRALSSLSPPVEAEARSATNVIAMRTASSHSGSLDEPKLAFALVERTTTNGVEQGAKAARMRKTGRIANRIAIGRPGADATREKRGKRPAIVSEITYDEWLARLPLCSKLSGVSKETFRRDALLWRLMQSLLRRYGRHARTELEKAGRRRARSTQGPFERRVRQSLEAGGPRRWRICPPVESGGCDGMGHLPVIGQCPTCRGAGFLVYGMGRWRLP